MSSANFRPNGGKHSNVLKAPIKARDMKNTLLRLLLYLKSSSFLISIALLASIMATAITIIGTRLNGLAVDHTIATGDVRGLALLCSIMLGLYLLNMLASYTQNLLMINVSQKTCATLRHQLFAQLQQLPMNFFDQQSSGDLMSRLTNDVDNLNSTLSQVIIQLISGVLSIIGMFIAMLLLSPLLTAVAMLIIPLSFITTKLIIKRSRRYFKAYQQQLGTMNGYIEETISGQKATVLFNQQQQAKQDFSVLNGQLQQSFALSHTFSVMGPFMTLISNAIYLLLTMLGAYLILTTESMTVGIVFSFLLYMRNFARPLNHLAGMFNTMQSALAGAERIFEIIDESPEQDPDDAKPLGKIQGHIVADDISFSYQPGKPILSHASFDIPAGSTVAIVGHTGAGKTTIISLLNGFYTVDGGKITIDGKNIAQITKNSLRKSIGIVLQDTFLFSESVTDNIRYGRLDATDEEVIQAAKLANAHSFIVQLERGYDTILSDNGHNLSHGQRQLLAIARAILADPPLLILDEATSSIDTRTERVVQKALQRLMTGRTSLVIAHRLSTIQNADLILVVCDGMIVEQGQHQTLLDQNGQYALLYNSQFDLP